jgi:hypothetical protein
MNPPSTDIQGPTTHATLCSQCHRKLNLGQFHHHATPPRWLGILHRQQHHSPVAPPKGLTAHQRLCTTLSRGQLQHHPSYSAAGNLTRPYVIYISNRACQHLHLQCWLPCANPLFPSLPYPRCGILPFSHLWLLGNGGSPAVCQLPLVWGP